MTPKATLYIVDGDPQSRHSLRSMVESESPQVSVHAAARDFLADLAPVHPCCLIADMCLPDLTCQALLEELQARRIQMPVLLVAAQADVPSVVRAMRLGAVDLCLKPVDPHVLLPLVERCLAEDAARTRQLQRIADARRRLANLTPRERQLFALVMEGKSNKEMGATLGISPRTVEHHRAHITSKLGIDRVAEMVRLGFFASHDDVLPELFGEVPTGEPAFTRR